MAENDTPGDIQKFSEDDAQAAIERTSDMASEYAHDPERTEHLLEEALAKGEKVQNALQNVWDGFRTLCRMVGAWASQRYKEVPVRTIVMAVGGIIYLVNPFDAIPDFIPGIGYLDDAAVLGVILRSLKVDLDVFQKWEESQDEE